MSYLETRNRRCCFSIPRKVLVFLSAPPLAHTVTPNPNPQPLPSPQGALEKTLEYQSFTAETEDNEDHTFCGIFFDLRANGKYPLSYLEIGSLWVRGQVGSCISQIQPLFCRVSRVITHSHTKD